MTVGYHNSISGNQCNFRQLQYIQSTGTQYIDAGFSAPNGFSGTAKLEFTSINDLYIAGSHGLGDPYGRNGVGVQSSKWQLGIGSYFSVSTYVNANVMYVVDFQNETPGQHLSVNGSTVIDVSYPDQYRFPENVFLFANQYVISYQMAYAKMKLYSIALSVEGETIRDFIPVLDKNDVPCLYDKVSKQLFYNKGSGQFIAGPLAI